MTAIIVLIFSGLLIFMIVFIVTRAIVKNQQIIGRPPVPIFFFILAKVLVIVNLVFLLLKGLNIDVNGIFVPVAGTDILALIFLAAGSGILFLSTFKLNRDLVFGLSSSESHQLQTSGIYSISRHPFYLGFLFILFASCLLNPHYINILAFIGTWIIHHFIMIKEEQFLTSRYGEEYRQYAERVKRYITF
jgi:protein-S-isoprenylcysteine O-methyltransferase Ste14